MHINTYSAIKKEDKDMPNVPDITTINIDETVYEVASLPKQIQTLVDLFNAWNRDEAELRSKLLQVQTAKEALGNTIVKSVNVHLTAEKGAEPTAEEPPATEI